MTDTINQDAEFPLGAIENGRAFMDRVEHQYDFTCEAGPLASCYEWQEARRCFEYLASWANQVALSHPASDVPGAEEVEAIRRRHEAAERNNRWDDIERYGDDAHADRATLLAFVDSLKFKAEISVASSDLDEMRAREAVWPGGLDRNDPLTPFGEACNDRATLLRLLDAARAELAGVREALGYIETHLSRGRDMLALECIRAALAKDAL